MDTDSVASVLVGLFDTEAAVGLALLAAVIVVIVHGLLKQLHRVDSDREARPG
jgi:hypothetical protein